jgi:spermidine synthase
MGRYHRFEGFSSELNRYNWINPLWRGTTMLTRYLTNNELLYYGDGIGGFTTVLKEIDALGAQQYILVNSGKPDASSRGDMPTQTLLAHFPLLFHPKPQEVMVIGLASGVTAGEVLYYPIKRLDVIEISEQVVWASNFFAPWNNGVLSNPKTELIIQDGRAHLAMTNRKYDIIISEPSNPWMAGLASLFTKESFSLAKKRLKKNGIFVQMFHSYQMDWSTFVLVSRTFSQVFPQSILLSTFPGTEKTGSASDYLLVGFKGKKQLSVNNADRNISFAQQSKNFTLTNPRVLYRLIASEDLNNLFGQGPIHSDNWPRLEFAAPKLMYYDDPTIEKNILAQRWLSKETKDMLQQIDNVEGQIAFATFALSVYRPFPRMVDLSLATAEQKKHFFNIMSNYCTHTLVTDYSIVSDQELREKCICTQIEKIENTLQLLPDKTTAYNHLGRAYAAKGELSFAIDSYKKALSLNPSLAEIHNNLGMAYWQTGMLDEAIIEFKKVISLDPQISEGYNNLGLVYFNLGRSGEAISAYEKAIAINPDFSNAHFNLGVAFYYEGRLDEAIYEYKRALVLHPNHAELHSNLGIVYAEMGRFNEAISEFKRALTLNPTFAKAYYNLGNAYRDQDDLDSAISEYKHALAIKPDYAEAHNNLSVAYFYKKNLKLALVHCNKAKSLGYKVNPKLLELLAPYRK